jgi:hypothetical protein
MNGQLMFWDAVTDTDAPTTSRLIKGGLGLLDTALLSAGSGPARSLLKTESSTVARTTSRIQQELQEAINFERAAQSHVQSLGETVIQTQYAQGAVQRGFDFASFTGQGANAKLFINEVKNVAGEVAARSFSALGLGKSGVKSFEKALDATRRAVRAAGLDAATEQALLRQLQKGGSAVVRVIGSQAKGTVFDPNVLEAIGKTTKYIAGHGFNL